MASIFSRIINGELPAYKVAENSEFIAFLDIRPLQKGHTLVVPKKEIDYIFDHDDTTLANLMVFCKKVALAIEKVVLCKRIGMAVVGLEVPHTHVHLVPLHSIHDIDFSRPKLQLSSEQMAEIAKAIAAQFTQ